MWLPNFCSKRKKIYVKKKPSVHLFLVKNKTIFFISITRTTFLGAYISVKLLSLRHPFIFTFHSYFTSSSSGAFFLYLSFVLKGWGKVRVEGNAGEKTCYTRYNQQRYLVTEKMGLVLGGGRCVKAYFAVKYVLSIYMLNSSKNDYGFYF